MTSSPQKSAVKMIAIDSRSFGESKGVWSIRFKRMGLAGLGVLILALFLPTHYYVDTQAVAMPSLLQDVGTVTGGRVEAIYAYPGDKVRAGQPLLQLENQDVSMRYEAAQADYGLAQLAFSQSEDSANATLKNYAPMQLHRLEAAFAVRETVRNQMESLLIRSPIDGTVIALPIERLKGVQIPPGMEVISVGDTQHYELIIPLQEAESVVVRDGDAVRGRIVGTGDVFETKLHGSVYRKALSSEYKYAFVSQFGGPAPQENPGEQYPGPRSEGRNAERALYPIYLADAPVPDDISSTLSPFMRVRVRITGERMLVIEKLIRIIRILFK